MKWVTFRAHDGSERTGVLAGDSIHVLEPPTRLIDLLARPGSLAEAGERALRAPDRVVDAASVTLESPIPRPPAVRDFYAFEQHVLAVARVRGRPINPFWYEQPAFYFSNPAAITGPFAILRRPSGVTRLDFELEVAAVVAGGGSNLTPAQAGDAIAGYTIMNDWSARDLQAKEKAVGVGAKAKDFATALGPWLVTPDELEDRRAGKGFDLAMTATVNGREYARATWSDTHWDFREMLAYASRDTELRPGDVLGSGTCGTGCIFELSLTHGEQAYPWLQPGDVVELAVERLGRQRQRVS